MDRATEEKVRELRERAQWLRRYAGEKPSLASVLTKVADSLDAEVLALEAEPPPPDNEEG